MTTMAERASPGSLKVVGAMLTDIGLVRSTNEDTVVFVAPAEGTAEERVGFLALVADGMGGHAAGEVDSSPGSASRNSATSRGPTSNLATSTAPRSS